MVKSPMVREIIQLGDEKLYQTSKEVEESEILSRETQELIDDMLDTCNHEMESTAGLSAIQVGVPVRIYIARRMDLEEEEDSDNPEWEVLINPKVEVVDPKPSTMWEGCLSVGKGDERLFAPVTRPIEVKVTYLDRDAKEKVFQAREYMSHVIQHEQDHIDGKLFLSYVKNPTNIWKSVELDSYIDENESFPPII